MSGDIKKNILSEEIVYMNIALIASQIRVLVVGAGKAGFIKSKSFLERGCEVTVVAPKFCEEFQRITNLNKIRDVYNRSFLKDNHFIIIAVDQATLVEEIIKHCREENKLFLNCKHFKEGSFIIPSQSNTGNINYSINTVGGNPKTSQFLLEVMGTKLNEYDNLVNFNDALRKKVKVSPYKNEILAFVASEDFNFFMKKAKHIEIINMFYRGDNFEFKNSN